MFRLFTDAENVRELLVHRCRSQHFEPRKRRGYEVLFAELLKPGAPSTFVTSETVPSAAHSQNPHAPEASPRWQRTKGSSLKTRLCHPQDLIYRRATLVE